MIAGGLTLDPIVHTGVTLVTYNPYVAHPPQPIAHAASQPAGAHPPTASHFGAAHELPLLEHVAPSSSSLFPSRPPAVAVVSRPTHTFSIFVVTHPLPANRTLCPPRIYRPLTTLTLMSSHTWERTSHSWVPVRVMHLFPPQLHLLPFQSLLPQQHMLPRHPMIHSPILAIRPFSIPYLYLPLDLPPAHAGCGQYL
ncbi:hypothetical protein O6H91_13G016900 [Diphasiastrum complanatum]|uniref:Uncharacterized protein n=1 Tax=Diphasiastrum complanatum TaxID=34168 RepID=A0ACC2BSJ9_DIPCM|nr:hypothetical protein O6H91_13G016900 [Diphasiastrum complanatum]